MGGYRLCRIKAAEHPYFIEAISTNVYTIEELCYYMFHNTALIDATFVGTQLTRWVAQELGLAKTATAMERAFLENKNLADFLVPVFEETGYLTAQEIRQYRADLEKQLRDPSYVRMKRKGDALARYGKFAAAGRTWRQALDLAENLENEEELPEEQFRQRKKDFMASVWHNIGVTGMKMLDYEESISAFAKACTLRGSAEDQVAYLTAFALGKPREKFEERAAELEVSPEDAGRILSRIDTVREELHVRMPERPEEYLRKLTARYHNAAGA